MKNSLLHALTCSLILGVSIHAGQGEVSQRPQAEQPSRFERCKAFISRHKGKLFITAGALSLYGLSQWYQNRITTEFQPSAEKFYKLYMEHLASGSLEKVFSQLDSVLLEELKIKYADLSSRDYIEVLWEEFKNRVYLELARNEKSRLNSLFRLNVKGYIQAFKDETKIWELISPLNNNLSPELMAMRSHVDNYLAKMFYLSLGESAALHTLLLTGVIAFVSCIPKDSANNTTSNSESTYQEIKTPEVSQAIS